ncbi:hypothetical protein [Streptomyces anulatus]|uniref:hypothetical protein n=1 Tax=Streptomyces anulatus TaxID=1892 RepID=UPI00342492DD
MPHFLIRFIDDEPDRIVKAYRVKPESRDGFDVYVAYGPTRSEIMFFTGAHVRSVEETVVPRGKKPPQPEG